MDEAIQERPGGSSRVNTANHLAKRIGSPFREGAVADLLSDYQVTGLVLQKLPVGTNRSG